ncbi:unnamed protein product [Urochloa decumbens]|uniref:Peptidase A1 domain-containing protein n=1 Tax=Urochloa decumbens TaxID=240449 RepID=A0ABC9AQZ5_9POAL
MAVKIALLALMASLLVAAAVPQAISERPGFRATLIRREKAINFTRAMQQSHERLSMFIARLDAAAGRVSTQTPLRWDGAGAYDMEFSMGTPPQKLTALADTGSDLIWAKCGACASCAPQGSPSYYPDKSSSFSKLPCSSDGLCGALKSESVVTCGAGGAECDYRYSYGLANDGHHYTKGYMGTETFTLGGAAAPGVGFGCTNMSEGNYGTGSGLVGLGRGKVSLVSQLDVGAFSYCLAPDTSKASPLLFGSMASLSGPGVQTTPLLPSNVFYGVNLKSITIGGATTTPGTDASDGGIVFDSGTTLTFLADPAYTAAKAALLSQMTALPRASDRDGFEACFQDSDSGGSVDVPTMVLHFDGADMDLPPANYFQEVAEGVLCWIVQPSHSRTSIIGNIMQMNYHVRHDLEKSVLSFQPANCDSL